MTTARRTPRGDGASADQDAKGTDRARPKSAANNRSGRRRRAKAGDLAALQRELWHVLRKLTDAIDADGLEVADLVRAANALAALGNAYRGVTEAAELVPRLEALEAAQGRP